MPYREDDAARQRVNANLRRLMANLTVQRNPEIRRGAFVRTQLRRSLEVKALMITLD